MSEDTRWIEVQKKTFTRWANTYLVERNMPIEDLQWDLADGLKLVNLLELISTHTFRTYNRKPRIINQKLENLNFCLAFLKAEGLKLVGIGAEDIMNGNLKLILGLIWTIILRYQIEKGRKDSAKNALLEWVRSKIPEQDVRNFTTSWMDGMAICALDNALRPGTVDMDGRTPANALQNATDGIHAADELMGIPEVFHPEDMVNAPDDLSCMTYISYFRDYDERQRLAAEEDEARRRAELLERTPDASKCTKSGPGLKDGEVNIPSDFVVTTYNAAGRKCPCGGASVVPDITAPDGSKLDDFSVDDKGDGTYAVTYTPKVPGVHTVQVLVNDEPLGQDPSRATIAPPTPDPSKCTASGPGVEGGTPAGVEAEFVVQACNRIGDPLTVGGHLFEADVRGPNGEEVPLATALTDNGDGTYTAAYAPIPGKQSVSITCNKKPIAGSPYEAEFLADPNRAFAGTTYAFGPGVEGGDELNTFDPAQFTIQAVNPDGEKLDHGGDEFKVAVEGPDGAMTPVEPKDNGDGTYACEYKAAAPGPHKVHVQLVNPHNPDALEHIKDSPYNVDVAPGLDPSKCLVYGPGVEEGVTDTDPTNFKIQTKDCNGNDMGDGGLPIEVEVEGPDGEKVPAEVKDNGDGTYDASYEPTSKGRHRVRVACKGEPIGESPYELDVEEGADASQTGIGTFSFTVAACGRNGKPLDHGGARVIVNVSCKEAGYKGPAEVADNGDGTYTATYAVPGPGEYKVSVKINGRAIKGSPLRQVMP